MGVNGSEENSEGRAPGVTLVDPGGDGCDRAAAVLRAGGLAVDAIHASTEDVVGSVDSGRAPGVVLILDGAEKLGAARQVRHLTTALPDVPVVVLAADAGARAIQSLLAAGGAGFVAEDRLDSALVPSVLATLAGQVAVPRQRRQQLHTHALTNREKQSLALVVMGMTNGDIAAKLFLAESTVKSHLTSAFNKLGVRSRNEATALILDPTTGVGMGILTIPTENASTTGRSNPSEASGG